MFTGVVAFLIAIFLILGWVGWRYFAVPMPHEVVATTVCPPGANTRIHQDKHGGQSDFFLSPHIRGAKMRPVLILSFLFVPLSAAGVLALSGSISLDPLSASSMEAQGRIQAALNPESLVPPPPLPPSTFIDTGRPGLESANRDWANLNRDFMGAALAVFSRMEARGYPLALLEGYRSPGRQDALADSSVLVTNARAYQSKHQFGLALDAAPVRDGRLVISENDPWALAAYRALGEEAEKAGLVWGGRWKLRDYGHIEVAGQIREYVNRR